MRDNQRAWLGTCSMCQLPKAGGVKILFMVKRYPAVAPEVVETRGNENRRNGRLSIVKDFWRPKSSTL